MLDANVFIEAARRYYAFDLAPRFWESLLQHAATRHIRSIDRVKGELDRGKDELADWADGAFADAFASTDEAAVISTFARIMTWVQGQGQFSDAAKAAFAGAADGWLVAYAHANGCVVVTHEVFAPEARRKIPIPNLCRTFGVEFIDTFELLRRLGVRFA